MVKQIVDRDEPEYPAFAEDELNTVIELLNLKDLNGVAFLISEKLHDFYHFNENKRVEYRNKLNDYICNHVNQDYLKLIGLDRGRIREELEFNLRSYIFHMGIVKAHLPSEPPADTEENGHINEDEQ
jgi:hypothetical protein